MNYCEKIHYSILTASTTDFPSMVDELLSQLPQGATVVRLILFGSSSSNEEYIRRREVFKEKVHTRYKHQTPAISYVAQPTLDAPLIMEVHHFQPESGDIITFRSHREIPYVIIENQSGRFLFAGGFQGDVFCTDIERQAKEAFQCLGEVLEQEAFPIDSIVRQWNYIERITDFAGDNQHYQSFNNARTEFYSQTEWSKGYPAATGIGTGLGGILIDVDAALLNAPEAFVTPIDNKLQVMAHAYSDQVLKKAGLRKTTPKFERAKSITCNNRRLVYISGTAAIRGEESLNDAALEEQLRITMENIEQLSGQAHPKLLRVYLKINSDHRKAKDLMKKYDLHIPIAYMQAEVCREELLIEIEGIVIE